IGRHKPGCPHYYPVLLKPDNYDVPGCDHGDVSLASVPATSVEEYQANLARVIAAENDNQYKLVRKATGISKPSIFSGFSRAFPSPLGSSIDLMHLTDLNMPDLLISIWRGVIKGSTATSAKTWPFAVLQGTAWTAHGVQVQLAMSYLPGFFDRAPRNIAEKISSGYKAAEYHTYLWNYAPAMLRRLLPPACWRHLCKTARSVQIIHHANIPLSDLVKAKRLLTEATREFEEVYVQRDADRIHLVRPCIHTLWHAPDEIVRRGSLICGTQHTLTYHGTSDW
ncbi:hypothetical protein OH77DRAFT_1554387, partial [Trametes cingulata]